MLGKKKKFLWYRKQSTTKAAKFDKRLLCLLDQGNLSLIDYNKLQVKEAYVKLSKLKR